jgi:hypothetical protein
MLGICVECSSSTLPITTSRERISGSRRIVPRLGRFINTIGVGGNDMVFICSNSHVAMDDLTSDVAIAAASVATGD